MGYHESAQSGNSSGHGLPTVTVRTDDPQQDGAAWGNGNLTGKPASLETPQEGQDPFYRVKDNHTHTVFRNAYDAEPQGKESKVRTDTGLGGGSLGWGRGWHGRGRGEVTRFKVGYSQAQLRLGWCVYNTYCIIRSDQRGTHPPSTGQQ